MNKELIITTQGCYNAQVLSFLISKGLHKLGLRNIKWDKNGFRKSFKEQNYILAVYVESNFVKKKLNYNLNYFTNFKTSNLKCIYLYINFKYTLKDLNNRQIISSTNVLELFLK